MSVKPGGIFQTLTTSYASEICPIALRPFLTTWVNSCWAMGKVPLSFPQSQPICIESDLITILAASGSWNSERVRLQYQPMGLQNSDGSTVYVPALFSSATSLDVLTHTLPTGIWPFPILVGCYFCPESPWWLVRHGRVEEARRVIKRITNEGSSVVYNSEHRENYCQSPAS